MMRRFLTVVALAGLLAVPSVAQAVPMAFDVQGIANPALTGNVTFSYNSISHIIDIEISNTSGVDGGVDPRITGFTFNAPDEVTGVSNFVSVPQQWALTFDRDDVNTPTKIGLFDVGTDSGATNNGISRTQPFTFSFKLAGEETALSALTELSFLELLSVPENQNSDPTYFSARFQQTGARGEGSDVAVPAGDPREDNSSVPEPATLLLLGLGGAALLGRHARRRMAR